MRTTFVETFIKNYNNNNNNIIFGCGDLGFNFLEPIRHSMPDKHFINFGIAEQNMITACSAMSTMGYKVFIYSLVSFMVYRGFEQIRNDLYYHNCDVTLICGAVNKEYGLLGYSHYGDIDIPIMQTLPGFKIYDPKTKEQLKEDINNIFIYKGPQYLRLRKAEEKDVFPI